MDRQCSGEGTYCVLFEIGTIALLGCCAVSLGQQVLTFVRI